MSTRRLLAALSLAAAAAPAWADPATATPPGPPPAPAGATLPKWEVGIGLGGGWLPHYPAAGEGGFRGLALPYLIYRGESVRVGEDGIARGLVVDTDAIELDISLDGSFDAESEDNGARQGMPDLDFLAEVGPQLVWKIRRTGEEQVDLALQARAVLSSDLTNLKYQGIAVQVRASYETRDFLGTGLGLVASGGPIFATAKVHRYFYQVDPAFARPGRPAYGAGGGYLGTEAFLGAFYRLDERVTLYAGGQLGLYAGAANDDSPLFREEVTSGVVAGLTWSFWQSERRVSR